MKKLEIIGYNRANLGKKPSKDIRTDSNVPCVLYGNGEQVHFYTPLILFRELIYTPDAYDVTINIEGKEYRAILQDAQFHPVNDVLIHADFLSVNDTKSVKVEVPLKFTGVSPGVQKGGKLLQKMRKIRLKGLIANIPDAVEVNIAHLDLGQTVKVIEVTVEGCEILHPTSNPVATIEIPRALRGK